MLLILDENYSDYLKHREYKNNAVDEQKMLKNRERGV